MYQLAKLNCRGRIKIIYPFTLCDCKQGANGELEVFKYLKGEANKQFYAIFIVKISMFCMCTYQ